MKRNTERISVYDVFGDSCRFYNELVRYAPRQPGPYKGEDSRVYDVYIGDEKIGSIERDLVRRHTMIKGTRLRRDLKPRIQFRAMLDYPERPGMWHDWRGRAAEDLLRKMLCRQWEEIRKARSIQELEEADAAFMAKELEQAV